MRTSIHIEKYHNPEGGGYLVLGADHDFSWFNKSPRGKRIEFCISLTNEDIEDIESQLAKQYGNDDVVDIFAEPKESGFYSTQSGQILLKDGDVAANWMTLNDGYKRFENWETILNRFDKSEFPLTKLTDDLVKKAVEQ